jgi:RHS repeat-associated protein
MHTNYFTSHGFAPQYPRAATSAGDADEAVRWDFCRLDFFGTFLVKQKSTEENNMNGRLYDPVIGRMFSPDKYVANSSFTQDFNRYSYARNNPLRYTDPSGHKLKWWGWLAIGLGIDALTGGVISTFAASTAITNAAALSTTGCVVLGTATATAMAGSSILSSVDFFASAGKAIGGNNQAMKNWWNLTWGHITNPVVSLFSFDRTAKWYEWPSQLINNSGGEILQSSIGRGFAHIQNIGGFIDEVGHYNGRTTIRLKGDYVGWNYFSGISFGHYVFGDNMALSPYDVGYDMDLFIHEYGHTYQSRIMGPMYLFRIGISSAIFGGSTEPDATRRGELNLGLTIENRYRFPSGTSTYKWWESSFFYALWPFMWSWNK